MEHVYLRPDIQVEPLVDAWCAWLHLIAPATAARNLIERYLRIAQSYVAAPQIHAAAVKNPKMRGGPFIDLNGERIEAVRDLIRQTLQARARLVTLSKAIEDLDSMLRT